MNGGQAKIICAIDIDKAKAFNRENCIFSYVLICMTHIVLHMYFPGKLKNMVNSILAEGQEIFFFNSER